MIVQLLLSIVKARSDLTLGKSESCDSANGTRESGAGIGGQVRIAKAIRRLHFVVRVGGADGVDNDAPYEFTSSKILAKVKKIRGQRRQVTGFVEMR